MNLYCLISIDKLAKRRTMANIDMMNNENDRTFEDHEIEEELEQEAYVREKFPEWLASYARRNNFAMCLIGSMTYYELFDAYKNVDIDEVNKITADIQYHKEHLIREGEAVSDLSFCEKDFEDDAVDEDEDEYEYEKKDMKREIESFLNTHHFNVHELKYLIELAHVEMCNITAMRNGGK